MFDTHAVRSESPKANFHPIFSSLPGNNGPTYKDFPLCGESKLVLCVFSDSPFVVSLHRFTRLCGNYSIWGAVFKAKSRESHSGIHFSTLTVYSGVEANKHWPFTISSIFFRMGKSIILCDYICCPLRYNIFVSMLVWVRVFTNVNTNNWRTATGLLGT